MRAPDTLATPGTPHHLAAASARLPRPAARLLTPLSLLAADLVAVSLSATAAVAFWSATGHPLRLDFYTAQWPLLAVFPAAYAADGLYSALALHPAEELRRLSLATTLVCLAFASMTFLAKEGVAYSRGVFLLAWLGCLVAVPVLRALVRQACGPRRWWGQATVLVGEGEGVKRLSAQLLAKPSLGLKPVGVAADVDEAREYRRRWGVRCAILAGPSSGAAVFALQQMFSRVIVVPESSGGLPSLRVESADLHGVLGLEMSHRLLRPAPVRLKALSDLALSALVTALALPLGAAIAVAVKLESPGPVFFGHGRRGRGGRAFRAWKFRTMVTDADAALARHLSENEEARAEWAATHKLARDPRVTRVGRWLRRWSLDELPQLWNVLRGEMSLVGPRPIVDEEVARYGPGYVFYERVRPGLTGLWQVSGRNRLTYEERVKLDLYYVSNWSLWLDLYILARTLRAVLQGEGW